MEIQFLESIPPWDWPENTGKKLLKILQNKDSNASDRLIAAELAGDLCVVNDDLADALLSIVCNGDEAEDLRGCAATSLGPALESTDLEEFEVPDDIVITEKMFNRIKKTLHELYIDDNVPKYVRRRILEASVRSPMEWHSEAVREAYSRDDDDWRLTAVFCMGYIRGFDDWIVEALESDNEDIQYEAVCAAGNWGVASAWPHIKELADSAKTDKILLLAVIEAMPAIRPEEAIEILSRFINHDDEDIVDAASEAITMAAGISGQFDDDDFL